MSEPLYYLDSIELYIPTQEGIILKVKELLSQGFTFSEISEQIQVPKSTLKTIKKRLALPKLKKSLAPVSFAMARRRVNKRLPFGYAWYKNQIVADPNEQTTIDRIKLLHSKGFSYRAISIELNEKKMLTRLGKKWDHSSVKLVLQRKSIL